MPCAVRVPPVFTWPEHLAELAGRAGGMSILSARVAPRIPPYARRSAYAPAVLLKLLPRPLIETESAPRVSLTPFFRTARQGRLAAAIARRKEIFVSALPARPERTVQPGKWGLVFHVPPGAAPRDSTYLETALHQHRLAVNRALLAAARDLSWLSHARAPRIYYVLMKMIRRLNGLLFMFRPGLLLHRRPYRFWRAPFQPGMKCPG